MGNKFNDIMFTPAVKELQRQQGSREIYGKIEDRPDFHHQLNADVETFLAERDSFYIASVTEDDWPYVQHRGGPKGFMRIVDGNTIGFADFSGNRQYISAGNFQQNDRVALFFMDYANRRRLKMIGHVETIGLDHADLLEKLDLDDYRAKVERGFLIHVKAFDWNCPQHITPRFDMEQVETLMASLQKENAELKQRLDESQQRT